MDRMEEVLAKLDEIMTRLDALESRVRADHVVIDGGTVHVHTGEHAPICVADAGEVEVDGAKKVSLNVGGDMNGDISSKKGKLTMKMKVKGGVDVTPKREDH